MNLRLRVREEESVTWVEVNGEIELNNVPQLREALLRVCEGHQPRLVVDLADVPFIDSTGIGVLVIALKRARERGGTFALTKPQARVLRVFEITGLLPALAVFSDAAEAQAYAAGASSAAAASAAPASVEAARNEETPGERDE